jgi:hypothetical protein
VGAIDMGDIFFRGSDRRRDRHSQSAARARFPVPFPSEMIPFGPPPSVQVGEFSPIAALR